jgi:hypothetical protein
VDASLKASHLWRTIEVLNLTGSMRLDGDDPEFSNFLMCVGNGEITVDAEKRMDFPPNFLVDSIETLIDAVYDNFLMNSNNFDYLKERAILCTTNSAVGEINDIILDKLETSEREYLSADSLIPADGLNENLYPPEFLHSLQCNGVPPHRLKLKVGCPVLLIRNINAAQGLCNGTRLMILSLRSSVVEAQVLVGPAQGQTVLIPRIDFIPHNKELPFDYKRRQFPLRVCYAMTINKSQGQTISKVGLDLSQEVFTHGQLYVALSRVKSASCLWVYLKEEAKGRTKNIVYSEVLT